MERDPQVRPGAKPGQSAVPQVGTGSAAVPPPPAQVPLPPPPPFPDFMPPPPLPPGVEDAFARGEAPIPSMVQTDEARAMDRFFAENAALKAKASRKAKARSFASNLVSPSGELSSSPERFPGEPVSQIDLRQAMAALHAVPESDQVKRILAAFPIFGEGRSLVIQEGEIPETGSLHLTRQQALDTLLDQGLIEESRSALDRFPEDYRARLEAEGLLAEAPRGLILTQLGYAILTDGLQAGEPEDVAYLADSQMATLSARLAVDGQPRAVKPFIQAARNLLLDAVHELGEGDPVRWGAAVRAIHNAVVMDLDRPGCLLPNGGGVPSDVFRSLASLAGTSNYISQAPRLLNDFDSLTAALEARDRVRARVAQAGLEVLESCLMARSTYQDLKTDHLGVKAMAHAAWVHLCRGKDADEVMDTALRLARAVTGVPLGEAYRSSDLNLLTPDHREHLLLADLYLDFDAPDRPRFAGTEQDALRRLVFLTGALEKEYPTPEVRVAAGVRVLQLHEAFAQESPEALDVMVRRIFTKVEDARDFGSEILSLAQNALGQPLNRHAISDLVRNEVLQEEPDFSASAQAMQVNEWVAVAERFSQFSTMTEANVYRFALMELLERKEDLTEYEATSMARMLRHATSLMTILAQQEQITTLPPTAKFILGDYTKEELLALVEGDGGRFGRARVPWLETEAEVQWRRMSDYLGIRMVFPEDLDRISSALLRITGNHVAPANVPGPQEPGQQDIAATIGLPKDLIAGLDRKETGKVLALATAVRIAKREGILCVHGPEGVSMSEAMKAHQVAMQRRKAEREDRHVS